MYTFFGLRSRNELSEFVGFALFGEEIQASPKSSTIVLGLARRFIQAAKVALGTVYLFKNATRMNCVLNASPFGEI